MPEIAIVVQIFTRDTKKWMNEWRDTKNASKTYIVSVEELDKICRRFVNRKGA